MSRFLLLAALLAVPTAHAQVALSAPPPPRPIPPPAQMAAEPAYDDYGYDGMEAANLSGPPDFRGTLTDQDPVYEERNAPMDTYTFAVRAGDEVTVTMSSSTFDTYLVVRAPNATPGGSGEWSNDDFGSTRVSQVSFNAAVGGTYTVIATAFSESGRGAYEIRTLSARPVVVSSTAGRLDYEDNQQIKGEFFDALTVRSPQSGAFYVELRPLGFNGYVRVTSPSGVRSAGQYQYGNERAIRVGPLQAESGAWTVDVTSAGEGPQVGAYDVVVFTLGDQ